MKKESNHLSSEKQLSEFFEGRNPKNSEELTQSLEMQQQGIVGTVKRQLAIRDMTAFLVGQVGTGVLGIVRVIFMILGPRVSQHQHRIRERVQQTVNSTQKNHDSESPSIL